MRTCTTLGALKRWRNHRVRRLHVPPQEHIRTGMSVNLIYILCPYKSEKKRTDVRVPEHNKMKNERDHET